MEGRVVGPRWEKLTPTEPKGAQTANAGSHRGAHVVERPHVPRADDLRVTGVTRNQGHTPPLGWSYAPSHMPTVGP